MLVDYNGTFVENIDYIQNFKQILLDLKCINKNYVSISSWWQKY